MFKLKLNHSKTQAFTLLEILLVVGIIAILAGIVILAVNPTKQFSQVRNTQRKANLSELNKALYQYYIDNSRYPTSVTTTLTEICDTEATSTGHSLNCTNKIDLSALVPTYLVAIPTDPQATGTSTGYKVMKDSANKVVLTAPQAELGTIVVIGNWCQSPIVDSRDGQQYTTVAIGTQCWMQQNLNVGTMINSCTPSYTGICTAGGSVAQNQGVSTTSIQKYCYNNSESNCNTNGGLYQWNQAMGSSTTAGAQGICPSGWHIPTDAEYKTLEMGQGMSQVKADETGWRSTTGDEGTKLKSGGSSGFNALINTYYRQPNGSFYDPGGIIGLWSSTLGSPVAFFRFIYSSVSVFRGSHVEGDGYSIRCLKN